MSKKRRRIDALELEVELLRARVEELENRPAPIVLPEVPFFPFWEAPKYGPIRREPWSSDNTNNYRALDAVHHGGGNRQ